MRYLVIIFLSLLAACQSPSGQENAVTAEPPENQVKTEQDSLFDEMMAIHDSVMPEMDHIYQLRQKIQTELDSLQASNSSQSDRLDALEQVYLNLAEADEAMMNWMRSNDFSFEGMNSEEAKALIAREKQAIQQVAEQIQTSIQEAETLLEEQ
uniref:Viral A-type inclusion protein n=1 Tax=Roseihalotalea indica TaxID=2867963 RepID=A0AA49GLM3_9BACT|nr:hypothetical protein K4G66_32475 [Tunicatimonas sp. TK19036]